MGTAMWPLDGAVGFNPISPAGWFDWVLEDKALFHALLYTTASYRDLLLGTVESREATVYMDRALTLLKERFREDCGGGGGEGVLEGTVAAVTCLALMEALRGNFEGWRIHMSGIKGMVELKGGIEKLSLKLQLKLHRADLTGAIDAILPPFFASNALPKLGSCLSDPSTPQMSILKTFLGSLPISHSLESSLLSLSNLSRTLTEILESKTLTSIGAQITFFKTTYSIRYAFINSPTLLCSNPLDLIFENIDLALEQERTLDEVLRLGALLYIQTTLQEFPLAAMGSRNLVGRLMGSVMLARINCVKEGELVVWLLMVGGMEARKGDGGRGWFAQQLRKLTNRLGIEGWEGVRRVLEGLWWIGRIHDVRRRRLWDEVEASAIL